MAAAEKHLAERQAQYEIGMARASATWEMVDEQLRAAAIEVERARQNHASAAADVDRLARRELELSSQLTDAAATQSILEGRLVDAETAVESANIRMNVNGSQPLNEQTNGSASSRRRLHRKSRSGATSKTGSRKPSARWTMRKSGTQQR